jgi:hypothetical protein
LSKVFEELVPGTLAETDGDGVMAGKIDDKYPLRIRRRGAEIPRVSKVDDQTKTFKGHAFEKAIRPDLELKYL